MNTSELLERAEVALTHARLELELADDSGRALARGHRSITRRATLAAIKRVLDAMQKTVAAVPVVAVLLGSAAWDAQAADQTAAIAKAEQAVVLATCKLNFLRDRPGAKKNDKEYFGFMFQCMSK